MRDDVPGDSNEYECIVTRAGNESRGDEWPNKRWNTSIRVPDVLAAEAKRVGDRSSEGCKPQDTKEDDDETLLFEHSPYAEEKEKGS